MTHVPDHTDYTTPNPVHVRMGQIQGEIWALRVRIVEGGAAKVALRRWPGSSARRGVRRHLQFQLKLDSLKGARAKPAQVDTARPSSEARRNWTDLG